MVCDSCKWVSLTHILDVQQNMAITLTTTAWTKWEIPGGQSAAHHVESVLRSNQLARRFQHRVSRVKLVRSRCVCVCVCVCVCASSKPIVSIGDLFGLVFSVCVCVLHETM